MWSLGMAKVSSRNLFFVSLPTVQYIYRSMSQCVWCTSADYVPLRRFSEQPGLQQCLDRLRQNGSALLRLVVGQLFAEVRI
jgi:hypothetical protein